jgi:hypothetical protein
VRLNNVIALESARAAVQTLAAIVPNAFSDQSTIMILVNFRNNPVQPYDLSFATQVLRTASDFFLENSYQQTFLSGLVKGWYTIDMDSPTSDAACNYSQISSLADQAATNAGVVRPTTGVKFTPFPLPAAGGGVLGRSAAIRHGPGSTAVYSCVCSRMRSATIWDCTTRIR